MRTNFDSSGVADADNLIPTSIVPEIHTDGSIEWKEDKSFVLPPDTVLAFGCVELSVGEDGCAKLHSTYDQLDSCKGELLAPHVCCRSSDPQIVSKNNNHFANEWLPFLHGILNDFNPVGILSRMSLHGSTAALKWLVFS